MQVLNVLGSSKLNKSNQVLSGCATISWLFEPSGPCSSDLSGFYLRKSFHKAFCSDVENTGSVYERDYFCQGDSRLYFQKPCTSDTTMTQ